MLNDGRLRKIRPYDCAPLGEHRPLTKRHRVILERFPIDHQKVSLWGLHAFVDLEASKALSLRNDGGHAALDGLVKFGLLASGDTDIGDF